MGGGLPDFRFPKLKSSYKDFLVESEFEELYYFLAWLEKFAFEGS